MASVRRTSTFFCKQRRVHMNIALSYSYTLRYDLRGQASQQVAGALHIVTVYMRNRGTHCTSLTHVLLSNTRDPRYNGTATAAHYNDPAAPVYVVNGAAGNREGNDHAPGGQPWEPPAGGNSTSKVSLPVRPSCRWWRWWRMAVVVMAEMC